MKLEMTTGQPGVDVESMIGPGIQEIKLQTRTEEIFAGRL